MRDDGLGPNLQAELSIGWTFLGGGEPASGESRGQETSFSSRVHLGARDPEDAGKSQAGVTGKEEGRWFVSVSL